MFPQLSLAAVAASPVCRNQKAVSGIMVIYPHLIPPITNALDGKHGRVLCYPHIYPTDVFLNVVHLVRHGHSPGLGQEIIGIHTFGHSNGMPFHPFIRKITDQFPLFRIYGYDWLSLANVFVNFLLDKLKLRIPVPVAAPLVAFPVWLQTETMLLERIPYNPVAQVGTGFFRG